MDYEPMDDLEDLKCQLSEKARQCFLEDSITVDEYDRLAGYIQKIETKHEILVVTKTLDEINLQNTPEENYRNINFNENCFTVLSYKNTPGSMVNKIAGKFITILGENSITINEADLEKDDTIINVVSILGSTKIYVPENIIVETHGDYLLGDLRIDKALKKKKAMYGSKKVILFGETLLGEIIVKTKRNLTTKDAKEHKGGRRIRN